MKIGKQGLDLIKEFEGLRLQAYMPTPHDVPTIGYGHTKTAKLGMVITKAGADALLVHDLAWVEEAVNKGVKVPLTQAQYDALCSFVYNLGATNFRSSTLLKRLNGGRYDEAASELLRWDKQGKKVLKGLTRRREAEMALFLSEPLAPTKSTEGASVGPLEALMAILSSIFTKRGK